MDDGVDNAEKDIKNKVVNQRLPCEKNLLSLLLVDIARGNLFLFLNLLSIQQQNLINGCSFRLLRACSAAWIARVPPIR